VRPEAKDAYQATAKQQEALPEDATSLPPASNESEIPPPPAGGQSVTTTTAADGTTTQTVTYAPGTPLNDIVTGNIGGGGVANGLNIRRPGSKKVPTISVSSVDMAALGASPYTTSSIFATPEEYSAEWYTKVLESDEQRAWWAKMAIGLGWAKYDPNSPFGISEADFEGQVRGMYEWAGEAVRMDPTLNRLTPEEWLQGLYNSNGGDYRYAQAKNADVPVTTNTQVSTTTIDKAQADAYADQVAMSVLGRMATDAELKKARSAMNKMLAANPTVTTQTIDRTDPANVKTTSHTQAGTSAEDAAAAYQMKMRRSSEGTAFTVGKGIEGALATLDRGL